jgi:hypothetical protein
MPTWIIDHWEFVVGALIAVALTVVQIWWQRQLKRLDWQPGTNEAIVVAGNEHLGSLLLVSWDGTDLTRPRLITLRVRNTGRLPVQNSDYTSGITVRIPDAEVVGAFVTKVSHPDVFPLGQLKTGSTPTHEVKLRPECINRKDWIDLQVIVDGETAHPDVSARFAGQSRQMHKYSEGLRSPLLRMMYVVLFATVALSAFFFGTFDVGQSTLDRIALSLGLAALVTLMPLWLYSIGTATDHLVTWTGSHLRQLFRKSDKAT